MRGCCLLWERLAQAYGTRCIVVVICHQTSMPAGWFAAATSFAVLKACGMLLVMPAAVSVDATAAIRGAAQAYVGDGSGTSWLFAKFRCERSSWNGRELWRFVTLSCEIFSLLTRIPVAIIVAKNESTGMVILHFCCWKVVLGAL